MIILIIMITIIQQITIKNQFLLRVTKINIFWHLIGCTWKYFPFLFPSQMKQQRNEKEMQKKVLSEFPKLKNYLISLSLDVIYVVFCEVNLHIVLYVLHFIYRFAISNTILWKRCSTLHSFFDKLKHWKWIYLSSEKFGILCARDWVRKKRQWSSVVSWKAIIIFIIFLTFSLCLFMFVGWCLQIYELYLRRVNGSFFLMILITSNGNLT